MTPRIVRLAAALVCAAGCTSHAPPARVSDASATPHTHAAPHGGTLVELGTEFAHVELVVDPDAASLTAFILDGEAEESVRIKQPSLHVTLRIPSAQVLELAAQASPLTGETVGDSSEFSVSNQALKDVRLIGGLIGPITVKGQAFTGVAF